MWSFTTRQTAFRAAAVLETCFALISLFERMSRPTAREWHSSDSSPSIRRRHWPQKSFTIQALLSDGINSASRPYRPSGD